MGLLTHLCVLALGFAAVAAIAIDPQISVKIKKFVSSEERIKSHGYPAESHFVETSDGYELNLFRLPYSSKLQNQNKKRPAILLQHGLFSNSDCWLNSGPDNSLAYNLVDAGYDVWLGNARGNTYSRKNNKISVNSPTWWRFSWHEIGKIDIAAMIDYITEKTDQPRIHYAGHSQGTTVYFVLMSSRPEYNAKIKSAHMLAPCAYFGHGTSMVFDLLAPLVGKPSGLIYNSLSAMELIPQSPLISRMIDTSCGPNPALGPMCKNMYLWFVGDGYQNMNMTSMQVLIESHPSSTSSDQGIHYIQLYVSGEFREYDFGTKKNQKEYGQATPPDYDLSQITAPTYLYSSQNDALCAPEDVNKLVANMPHLTDDYRIPEPSWNHLDFIAANQIKEVVNDRVIRICNEIEGF